jgi:hypothetical protein
MRATKCLDPSQVIFLHYFDEGGAQRLMGEAEVIKKLKFKLLSMNRVCWFPFVLLFAAPQLRS